ncbi:hypothetical protein TNCV_1218651 [Trichonephila clavipes]|nr:hypothetical protein TNCV_1218651 [Trichonephila clavipes]
MSNFKSLDLIVQIELLPVTPRNPPWRLIFAKHVLCGYLLSKKNRPAKLHICRSNSTGDIEVSESLFSVICKACRNEKLGVVTQVPSFRQQVCVFTLEKTCLILEKVLPSFLPLIVQIEIEYSLKLSSDLEVTE